MLVIDSSSESNKVVSSAYCEIVGVEDVLVYVWLVILLSIHIRALRARILV